MSKRAEEYANAQYPQMWVNKTPTSCEKVDYNEYARRAARIAYEQAEKDIWDRIEKYLKTRHHMNYATVGWILDNLEYYKQKIMEEE